jgi:hypothetical protein
LVVIDTLQQWPRSAGPMEQVADIDLRKAIGQAAKNTN